MEENLGFALELLGDGLNQFSISYAITGSVNLTLHGMDVKPNDIDVLTKIKDLDEISRVFSKYLLFEKRKLESVISDTCYEVGLRIYGVDIQVIGDEGSVYSRNMDKGRIEIVKASDVDLRCFTLAAEEECYRLIGREEKAKMIRNFLTKTKTR